MGSGEGKNVWRYLWLTGQSWKNSFRRVSDMHKLWVSCGRSLISRNLGREYSQPGVPLEWSHWKWFGDKKEIRKASCEW